MCCRWPWADRRRKSDAWPNWAMTSLGKAWSTFETRGCCELSLRGDLLLVRREAVLYSLTHVGRSAVSYSEAAEHVRRVAAMAGPR